MEHAMRVAMVLPWSAMASSTALAMSVPMAQAAATRGMPRVFPWACRGDPRLAMADVARTPATRAAGSH